MTLRILLVDDHRLLRDGMRAYLQKNEAVEVVGEADDGREAVRLAEELNPNIVVMDVSMPNMNGIEATRQITKRLPDVRVLALSMYSDKRYVLNMLEAGASGFVLKNCAGEDLLRAVEAVAEGRSYLSVDTNGPFEDEGGRPSRKERVGSAVLGAREREVLQLLAEGKTSRQIGDELSIATKTVETHRRNIMRKLEIHSVAALTKFAVREGLTPLDS